MQLRRVVIGTDFSDASIAAARWVAAHLVSDGELVLVHAIDLPTPPVFLRRLLPTPDEVAENLRVGAEQRMDELAESLPDRKLHTVIRPGSAPQVVADAARECDADLIVVGEHGLRRGVRSLIGTTAERLLTCAPVPVLVARDLPAGPPSVVLAPLDGSDADSRVLSWARTFCDRFGSKVTACHAVDVMELYRRVRTLSAASRLRELEHEFRRDATTWVQQRLAESGLPDPDTAAEIRIGDPRYAIPAMAELAGADLIIMGGAGAGAVSRAVIGSVTSAVLSSTSYPVLVVVGDRPAEGARDGS
jgi:nucleotide-binding universal stress UspA family protein